MLPAGRDTTTPLEQSIKPGLDTSSRMSGHHKSFEVCCKLKLGENEAAEVTSD